jgi:signal transduction histidine kinase
VTGGAEVGTASSEVRADESSGVLDGAVTALFAVYVAGLLLWLVLGLLPSLSASSGTLHSWLLDEATGSGPLATFSRRVLAHGATQSGWSVAVQYLFSALNVTLALLLAALRWNERVPRLLAFALLGTAATFNEPSHTVFHLTGEPPLVTVVHLTFHVVSGVAYVWAVVLFPDGHLPFASWRAHPWRVRGAFAALTVAVTVICWHSSFVPHQPFFVLFFGILVAVAGFASQTARLRRPAGRTPQDLAQSRLLRTALVPAMALAALWLLASAATLLGGSMEVHAEAWKSDLQGFFPAVFAVVPVALLIGILRYRLFQIDTLASRTFLYGLLAGFVTVTYALLVTVTGALVGSGAWAAVLAMTLVALAVEPARVGLHRVANRLVFGQEQSPAEALRSLADGLERLGPADELQELCRVVVTGTRAVSSARVLLQLEGEELAVARYPLDARDGEPDQVVPIGDAGRILLSLHRGLRLRPHEQRLLQDIADHAGLMVRNAVLAAELARQVERVTEQAAELRRSRELVVTSQDAERRRLERDLHDGAQQELIAVLLGLQPAAAQAASDPDACARELDELEALLFSTSRTMAELCDGDLPAPLVEGGIGAGLRAALPALQRSGVELAVQAELDPRPPLDVEAAVYYCCLEALQNAAKHARAGRIEVVVTGSEAELAFAVRDDGAGFDAEAAAAGSGLANMNGRLAVLGGAVTVESEPGSGTQVRGRVPLGVPA